MELSNVLLVIVVLGMLHGGLAEEKGGEFCHMEGFNATCAENEVILMTRGRYGRMQIGRCVKRNLGYVGCAVDVLPYLDGRCSGRQTCAFLIPNPELHDTQPCPDDTTSYLQATYTCVPVQEKRMAKAKCTDGTPLPLTAPTGYISSAPAVSRGLGTAACPWEIRAPAGQRINMTVYGFHRSGTGSETWRPDICYEYAVIMDGDQVKRVTVCGGERRQAPLYVSRGSKVTVEVVGAAVLKELGPFLIRYDVIGCADLAPPAGGHVTRDGDNAIVRCNNTNEVWYLTCSGTAWLGQKGNCSGPGGSQQHATAEGRTQGEFPYGILIVVAIGVALGVFIGGVLLLCASFYMKRRHHRGSSSGPPNYHMPGEATLPRGGKMLVEYDPDTQTWERGKMIDPSNPHYTQELDRCNVHSGEHVMDTRVHYDPRLGPPPYLTTATPDAGGRRGIRPHIYEAPSFS